MASSNLVYVITFFFVGPILFSLSALFAFLSAFLPLPGGDFPRVGAVVVKRREVDARVEVVLHLNKLAVVSAERAAAIVGEVIVVQRDERGEEGLKEQFRSACQKKSFEAA